MIDAIQNDENFKPGSCIICKDRIPVKYLSVCTEAVVCPNCREFLASPEFDAALQAEMMEDAKAIAVLPSPDEHLRLLSNDYQELELMRDHGLLARYLVREKVKFMAGHKGKIIMKDRRCTRLAVDAEIIVKNEFGSPIHYCPGKIRYATARLIGWR